MYKTNDKVVIAVPDGSRKHLTLPLPENGTEAEVVGYMMLVVSNSVTYLVAPYHLAPAELEDEAMDEGTTDTGAEPPNREPMLEQQLAASIVPPALTSIPSSDSGEVMAIQEVIHENLKAALEAPTKMIHQFEVELDGVNHVCYTCNKEDGPVTVVRPARKGRPSYKVLDATIHFESEPTYTVLPITDIPEGARKAFADIGIQ